MPSHYSHQAALSGETNPDHGPGRGPKCCSHPNPNLPFHSQNDPKNDVVNKGQWLFTRNLGEFGWQSTTHKCYVKSVKGSTSASPFHICARILRKQAKARHSLSFGAINNSNRYPTNAPTSGIVKVEDQNGHLGAWLKSRSSTHTSCRSTFSRTATRSWARLVGMILAFLLLPACFVSLRCLSTHSTTPSVLLCLWTIWPYKLWRILSVPKVPPQSKEANHVQNLIGMACQACLWQQVRVMPHMIASFTSYQTRKAEWCWVGSTREVMWIAHKNRLSSRLA